MMISLDEIESSGSSSMLTHSQRESQEALPGSLKLPLTLFRSDNYYARDHDSANRPYAHL